MAKSTSTEVDDLPARVASAPGPKLMLAYRLLKGASILVGFVATMIGLSACIGALTGNVYARVIGALVVTIAVPLGIADRLLPKDDPARAKGIVTEVMAVTWVLFGFVFATAANSATRGLLVREGDRFQQGGHEWSAQVAYFLAGVRPQIAPAPAPDASSSPSATATASATTSALAATATATATASATASVSAAPTAAPKAEKPEKTPAELFKEQAPMVVTIFVKGAVGDGGGTGFLIDKGGTIVTNHHVIDNAKQLKIKLFSGTAYTEVELLADDANVDLAILKIDPTKPAEGTAGEVGAVTLGDSEKIVVGERAVSIGNPLGLEHTLTDGLVSSRRMYEGRAWIQMSVPVSPGNSGGPVFNMHGEVIGITTAQLGGAFGRAQNLNLAVPVNELKRLIKTEYPGRRKIGESGSAGRW